MLEQIFVYMICDKSRNHTPVNGVAYRTEQAALADIEYLKDDSNPVDMLGISIDNLVICTFLIHGGDQSMRIYKYPSHYPKPILKAILDGLTELPNNKIGKMFGVSGTTILYHMNELGLESRAQRLKRIRWEETNKAKSVYSNKRPIKNPLGLSDWDLKETLHDMLERKLLRKQMSYELKCSDKTTYKHLVRFGFIKPE